MSCPIWLESAQNETMQFEHGKERRMGQVIVKMVAEVQAVGGTAADTSSFGPTENSSGETREVLAC